MENILGSKGCFFSNSLTIEVKNHSCPYHSYLQWILAIQDSFSVWFSYQVVALFKSVPFDVMKRYLSTTATSRSELATKLSGEYFAVDGSTYHVSQVFAEKSSNSMPASTLIGGALGLVGGMTGVLIGGALGALLGNESDKKEDSIINVFNRS